MSRMDDGSRGPFQSFSWELDIQYHVPKDSFSRASALNFCRDIGPIDIYCYEPESLIFALLKEIWSILYDSS